MRSGAETIHSYNDAGWISALTHRQADETVISSFVYTHDNVGNRRTVSEDGGEAVTWTYDSANQLVREQRSGDNSYDISYSYDGVGNRLTKLDGSATTAYSYDEANELITATDPESNITTYSYDANGNLTAQDAAGAVTSYAWDYDNRLQTVTLPDDSVTSFAYDGDGLRRESQSPAETTRFIWDGQDVLLETDDEGTTQVAYTQTPEVYGALVSQRRGETTSFRKTQRWWAAALISTTMFPRTPPMRSRR